MNQTEKPNFPNDFGRKHLTQGSKEQKEAEKQKYKLRIFELFTQGKTPETITSIDLARVFVIDIKPSKEQQPDSSVGEPKLTQEEKDLNNKISNKFRIFTMNRKETLEFLYNKYQEKLK